MKKKAAPWPATPREARAVQESLREKVETQDRLGHIGRIAGVDVHYPERGVARGAVAVLRLPGLDLAEWATASVPVAFPYVPGLLSFREAPAILAALERLASRPHLLLFDGHGIAHPRRFGLASHVGVLTGLPAIGVAKSRLVGEHDDLRVERGSRAPLVHDGEVVGAVLRTQRGVRPVYVSVGHRVALDTAIGYVLRSAPRFRIPEPIRLADRIARWGGPCG